MTFYPVVFPVGGGGGISPPAGDIGGTAVTPTVVSTHLAVATNATASGTVTLDPTSTRVFSVTETGNVTFVFGGTETAGTEFSFALYLFQDGTGGRTTTWPGSVSWVGGVQPVLPTAAGASSILIFSTINGGSTWFGSAVQELPTLPLSVANGGTGNSAGNAVSATSLTGGGLAPAIRLLTGAYSATATDCYFFADPDAGGFTITLPSASGNQGQTYCVMDTGLLGNFVTVTAVSGNVGNTASYILYAQYQCIVVTSDGTNWQITGFPITQGGQTFNGPKQFNSAVEISGGVISNNAAASSPTFVSGTAQQVSTAQDVTLYIAVQTSAALAVAIGPTSGTATSLMPSQSYALGLIAVRVPSSWYVKITGTIADLTITAVTC